MNWLLFEDKMITLDKFNTILNPIMIYIAIVFIITSTIGFVNYMEFKSTGINILNNKTRKIIKIVFLLFLAVIIIVGLINIIQHYLEELMIFDGYMYIDYKKQIIEIQK